MLNHFRQNLYDSKICFYLMFLLCTVIFLTMCLAQSFSSESLSDALVTVLSGLGSILIVSTYILFYIRVLNSFMQELYWGHTILFMSAASLKNLVGSKLLLTACWELFCNTLIVCALRVPVTLFHLLPESMESIFLFSPGSSTMFSGLANTMILLFCAVITKDKGDGASPLLLTFAPFLLLLLFKNGLNPATAMLDSGSISVASAYLYSTLYMAAWIGICYKITSYSVKKQKQHILEQKSSSRHFR